VKDIRDLRFALANLNEKQQEHDKALADYSGHSWGYFGSHYIEAVDAAEKEFAEELEKFVAKVVEEKLSQTKQ
jgi:hypothetical protein